MSRKVVIDGSCRTALGKMGASLANIPAVQLGAVALIHSWSFHFITGRRFVKPRPCLEIRISIPVLL